jgi:chromosome segregation ATPase
MLILLFSFLFYISETDLEKTKVEDKNEILQENVLNLENQKNILSESFKNLESNYEYVLEKNENLSTQIDTFKNLYKELSEVLNDLIQKADLSSKDYPEIQDLVEQLSEYEVNLTKLYEINSIIKRFFKIHIGIIGEKNEIIINDEKTNFYIFYEEISNAVSLNRKINSLADLIEKEFTNTGIAYMTHITIEQLDDDVYKFGYEVLIEAVKLIQSKYGPTRIFFTEIPYLHF